MHTTQKNLHHLTNTALETLQLAFQKCHHAPTDGLILSALVLLKQVEQELAGMTHTK